ncbi:MAG TPA: hypothetical protein VFJ16_00950 [Longimicrobium sp.]|nr:hypothetical protein [Longimicrobium sp.]
MSEATGCGWLPALVELSSAGGDWNGYVDVLYNHFCNDFIRSKPAYPGKRWAMKRYPLLRGKEATFWHIVTEGEVEDERLPNLRRCERIRWPRAMIDACQTGKVRCWRQKRGREVRTAMAPESFEYLVILAERGDSVLLWTAFPVEHSHQRRKLQRECEHYERTGQPV